MFGRTSESFTKEKTGPGILCAFLAKFVRPTGPIFFLQVNISLAAACVKRTVFRDTLGDAQSGARSESAIAPMKPSSRFESCPPAFFGRRVLGKSYVGHRSAARIAWDGMTNRRLFDK